MANVSVDMTVRNAFWKKKIFIFERQLHVLLPMEAKYTHLDNSIPPVWQQL